MGDKTLINRKLAFPFLEENKIGGRRIDQSVRLRVAERTMKVDPAPLLKSNFICHPPLFHDAGCFISSKTEKSSAFAAFQMSEVE